MVLLDLHKFIAKCEHADGIVVSWKRPTNLQESENVEYQILTENAPSEPCSISRIKAELLIQLDVPFGFGGMTARWTPSGLI